MLNDCVYVCAGASVSVCVCTAVRRCSCLCLFLVNNDDVTILFFKKKLNAPNSHSSLLPYSQGSRLLLQRRTLSSRVSRIRMPPRHVHAASAPSSNPRYSQCPHTNIHTSFFFFFPFFSPSFFPSLFSPSFFPPGFVCGQAVLDAVRPGLVDGNPRGLVWLDATSGRADAAAALAEDLWDQHSLRYLDCVSGFYGSINFVQRIHFTPRGVFCSFLSDFVGTERFFGFCFFSSVFFPSLLPLC